IDELNTQDDIDKQIRLEKAAAQLHEQTQRVLRQAETLPAEDSVQIRRQAKRVLQETSDSIRNAISASSDDSKRVPLQTLLTVIEDNGRSFGENGEPSSSSSSSQMIASSSSSAQILRPLPGGVGVPDPAVITITIGGSEASEDSSSSEAAHSSGSSESSAPAVSTSSASRSSSIEPRPPVLPAEPIVPPPVRLPLEPSKPVVSSTSSLSLSAPSINLPTGSLGL
ncbi:MAG: hypothetical protein KBC95_00560, partial [Candidatus Peribacteraceae bacterium]|nr:hypothetical protein [Candidatus Peribacteraceae bacterium]